MKADDKSCDGRENGLNASIVCSRQQISNDHLYYLDQITLYFTHESSARKNEIASLIYSKKELISIFLKIAFKGQIYTVLMKFDFNSER